MHTNISTLKWKTAHERPLPINGVKYERISYPYAVFLVAKIWIVPSLVPFAAQLRLDESAQNAQSSSDDGVIHGT